MVQGRAGGPQNFRDRRLRDRFGQEALNLGFPTRELGRPEDLSAAPAAVPSLWPRPSLLVRSAIKSRSISAKSPNSVIMTFVWRSWVPLSRMFSLMATSCTLLEEAVHQLDDLPHTPPEARELANQDQVARWTCSHGIQPRLAAPWREETWASTKACTVSPCRWGPRWRGADYRAPGRQLISAGKLPYAWRMILVSNKRSFGYFFLRKCARIVKQIRRRYASSKTAVLLGRY